MAKPKEIFTGQMPEGSYFLMNCLAKGIICQLVGGLAAGIYGQEEACLLYLHICQQGTYLLRQDYRRRNYKELWSNNSCSNE